MRTKMLIVDNDDTFIKSVKYIFKDSNILIRDLPSTTLVDKSFVNTEFDLIILELNMPKKSGLEVCKEIRRDTDKPIIMVSDSPDELRKILCLEEGADDFLVKPINPQELKARVLNIIRRYNSIKREDPFRFDRGEFTIDAIRKKVISEKGEDLNLIGKEFDLFFLLSSQPGRVFSREELMSEIWEYEDFGTSRTVDVHIRKLRSKLEKHTREEYILTQWGQGYYFKA